MATKSKTAKVSKALANVRHLAAYKAHLTRNTMALKKAKSAEAKKEARANIQRLTVAIRKAA